MIRKKCRNILIVIQSWTVPSSIRGDATIFSSWRHQIHRTQLQADLDAPHSLEPRPRISLLIHNQLVRVAVRQRAHVLAQQPLDAHDLDLGVPGLVLQRQT